MTSNRINKTVSELKKRIMKNGGRLCEVSMIATGETVKVCRRGYGPFEKPERDPYTIFVNETEIDGFKDLQAVAEWMCNRS